MIIDRGSLEETCGGCPMIWEGKTIDGNNIYIRIRHGGLRISDDDTNETLFLCDTESYGVDGVCSQQEMVNIVEKESNGEIKIEWFT